MKTYHAWALYVVLGVLWLRGAEPEKSATVIGRGPHHREWKQVVATETQDGATVWKTNQYTELNIGMHYWRDNEWKESRELIEIVQGGALASQGAHQVGFAANINTFGAINMLTSDDKRLRSHVLGLAYTDAESGQSVMIAPVRDAIGMLVGDNQIIYADAFDGGGFKADIRYTYRLNGFEQDIIIRNPAPNPADFGFNPASTRLEVFTEFVDAPAPTLTQNILPSVLEPAQRVGMAMPNFVDQHLDFGLMQISNGRAFPLGDENAPDSVPTGKTWEVREGRVVLIEAVQYSAIKPHLDRLVVAAPVNPANPLPKVHAARAFPAPPKQARADNKRVLRTAALTGRAPGFVIDYDITASATNFTFKGDTTYFMSGLMEMSGTTIFEGGAVLKYTNRTTGRPRLALKGPVEFRTTPTLPIVFTAKDDNSYGATINGSSGTPLGYYADLALYLNNSTEFYQFTNFIMGYASEGISGVTFAGTPTKYEVHNGRFFKCNFACRTTSTNLYRNCIFSQCNSAFIAANATNDCQQSTFARCGQISSSGSPAAMCFTNCLFVANTNLTGLAGGAYNATNSVFSDVFETAAYGEHYLKNDLYRGVGTANIDARLLAMLRQRTTYAPFILTNYIAADLTLSPTVYKDVDASPDLGYHYTPLDYIANGVVVSNATLTLTNGVAVGIDYAGGASGWGFLLKDNAKIVSSGNATNLNKIVRAHLVQEQSGSNPPSRAVFYDGASTGVSNEIRARFTLFAQLADDGEMLSAGQKMSALEWQHSAVYNASMTVDLTGDNFFTGGLTNNLWERTPVQFVGDGGSTNSVHLRNNLLRNCTNHFFSAQASWSVYDNLVDSGGLHDHGNAVTNGNNAYYSAGVTLSGGAGNLSLGGLSYHTGPLGKYYQPTNSSLINAGSRNGDAAGLYHFTMTTNQVKETNSVVDIGLHYVATDATGTPLDFDSDGLPDYWEDRNGNGSFDLGEISWQNADTDGDGVADGLELLQGRNPLGGTLSDTNNLLNLRVYTPLK